MITNTRCKRFILLRACVFTMALNLLLITTGGGAPLKEASMLWTIAVILIVLWALGLVSSYTMGGFIHILLVLAIVVILVRLIEGRRIA